MGNSLMTSMDNSNVGENLIEKSFQDSEYRNQRRDSKSKELELAVKNREIEEVYRKARV